LPLREKWERNPARGAPLEEVEPKGFKRNMRTLAKERRRAKFAGGVAFAENLLCIGTCDCLAAFLQGVGEAEVARRHGETLQIMEILFELCAKPQVLGRWKYSAEQIEWFEARIGPAVGAGREPLMAAGLACDEDVAQARWLGSVEGPGSGVLYSGLESTPFLVPLLCALLSPTYKLLPLARMLGRASRGRWCKGGHGFRGAIGCRVGGRLGTAVAGDNATVSRLGSGDGGGAWGERAGGGAGDGVAKDGPANVLKLPAAQVQHCNAGPGGAGAANAKGIG
jgi:hypothetical protein